MQTVEINVMAHSQNEWVQTCNEPKLQQHKVRVNCYQYTIQYFQVEELHYTKLMNK